MRALRNHRDAYGTETFLRNFPESTDIRSVDMRDGALVTVPVPDGAALCIISGSNYWVSVTGDFTIPTAAGVTTVTAEYEGSGYVFNSGETNLYFKSEINTKLTVSFYR